MGFFSGLGKARDLFFFCAFTSLRYSDVVEVQKTDIVDGVMNITLYRNGTHHDDVYPKWMQIGTHAGRKTFICFALPNGVPPDVVMKFTGHSDYKSMKPYIDITESAKRDAIAILERIWDAK